MPGRRQRASSTDRLAPPPNAVTLAVLHRGAKGESVERHVAPLRRTRRVSLVVSKQTASLVPPRGTTGILWELSADAGLDRRRVSALLERAPTASYAATGDRLLVDLSRSLGFLHHLTAPLRWPEVERALGLPGAIDLADRLERAATSLRRLAARAEVLSDLVAAATVKSYPNSKSHHKGNVN